MFNTKGQEVKTGGGTPKTFQPGVVYAHIFSGQVRTSNKGDKKTLELILEGPALSDGFEGWAIEKGNEAGPKYKGQSARVGATSWTDQFNSNDVNKNDILNKITVLATELGLRNELDKIGGDPNITTIEAWVAAAIDILKGHNMYFFLKGTEEEYNGKTIVKLSLPKYRFASLDSTKVDTFDKNNVYHYKALVAKSVNNFDAAVDDFTV